MKKTLERFIENTSPTEEIKNFRNLQIGLVKRKNWELKSLVKSITEEYSEKSDILSSLNTLNKELDASYKGKYYFDLTLESSKNLDELKLANESKRVRIKEKLFKLSNDLDNIKTKIEKKIC
jgi:hypothetical protein